MWYGCDMERIFEYIATEDGSVESLLKSKGYSSRICNLLKKELGLVCVNDKPVFVVEKIKATPKKYPRQAGTPNKKPL